MGLTVQWHYVVCSRMMEVEAHTSCKRERKKKKKRFYKSGKMWEIKASLLTDIHLTIHSTISRAQMPVMLKCLTQHKYKKT